MSSLRLSVVLIATLLFAITQARLYDNYNNKHQLGRSSLNNNYEGRLDSLNNNYEGRGGLLNNNNEGRGGLLNKNEGRGGLLNKKYEGKGVLLNDNYERRGGLLTNIYGGSRGSLGGVSSTTRRETQTTRHVVQDNDRLGLNNRNRIDSLRDTTNGYNYNNNIGVNARRGVVGSGYDRL